MNLFQRTATALALGLALTGGAMLALAPVAFVAKAQEPETAETRFVALVETIGIPFGFFRWAAVRQEGDDFIVTGLYIDIASIDPNAGFKAIPMGDLRLSKIRIEGEHVTAMRADITGLDIDLPALAVTGRSIMAAGGEEAAIGMMLIMAAEYLRGLGYSDIQAGYSYEVATDLKTGVSVDAFNIQLPGLFDAALSSETTGVTAAYIAWVKACIVKIYLDDSPESEAEINRQVETEDGPYSGVGFSKIAFSFNDQGLMPKFETYLSTLRLQMLGTNPDGTPKTELTEDELKATADSMARGVVPAEKMLPVVRALYKFLIKPDVLKISASFQPAITLRESGIYATERKPPPADFGRRITFEASN